MKKPTKKELYTRLKEFEQKELNEATKKEQEFAAFAMRYYDGACALLWKKLRAAFGGAFTRIQFEHVDGAGFWFSFELVQDKTRQTYRIDREEAKKEFYTTKAASMRHSRRSTKEKKKRNYLKGEKKQ